MSIDGADSRWGELWFCDGTAVAYMQPGNVIVGPMRDATIDTDPAGQLIVMGTVDGEPVVWSATEAEQVVGTYRDATVTLADGSTITGLVTATNHKVTVGANGSAMHLAGARVRGLGGRYAAIEQPGGPDLAMSLPEAGCGCGGPSK